MGLTDKLRAQASQVAQKTQETAQAGKAKYDQAQASRHADAMLQQLGAAVYTERTGRGTADSQAKIEKLINDISAYERENGLNLTDQPQPTVPQPGSPPDGAGQLSDSKPCSSAGQAEVSRPNRHLLPTAVPAAPATADPRSRPSSRVPPRWPWPVPAMSTSPTPIASGCSSRER